MGFVVIELVLWLLKYVPLGVVHYVSQEKIS